MAQMQDEKPTEGTLVLQAQEAFSRLLAVVMEAIEC